MNLRFIAYNILYDVKYKQKYSNIVINEIFKSLKLNDDEKNFVTFICYGVLSNIYYLDYFIKKYSDIAFSKISKQTRLILEIAFFEFIFMNSSVDYATVNEAVTLSKKCDFRSKNFVNAILRNFSSDEKNILNAKNYNFDDIQDNIQKISTKYSVSNYIAKRLIDNYDLEFTNKLMESMANTPNIFIRANNLKIDFINFKKELENLKLNFEIIDEKHMIFSITNFKNIADTDIYKRGLFSIQDYSSMQCVLALAPQENEKILDICSAPGGKSIFISQLMNNKGSLLSMDISQNKLNLLDEQVKRLDINIVTTKVNDATIFNENYVEQFDRILADVPCSGLGILRRKPEIRYKNFEDIEKIISIQKTILFNCSSYLKKGGRLVYSTCTLGKEENIDIVNDFINKNKNFKLIYTKEYYPYIDNTDGFFVFVIEK